MSVREFFPDKPNQINGIVFSEVCLPELSGLSLVTSLVQEQEQFPVLLLPTGREVHSVIQSGADFLIRPVNAAMINEAFKWTVNPKQYDEKAAMGIRTFAPREMQVLEHVVLGKTSAQTAVEFVVKRKTVEALRFILYAKMEAQNSVELIRMSKAWKALGHQPE